MSKVTSAEFRKQRKRLYIAGLVGIVVCVASLYAGYQALPGRMQFPDGMMDRLVFTLRLNVFVLLWLLYAVGDVSRARRHSASDINAALQGSPSPRVAIKIALLQNTLEQVVLFMGASLALATLIPSAQFSLLVTAAILFWVGRIAFMSGYKYGAGGRAFGIVLTVLPSFMGYFYAVYLIATL